MGMATHPAGTATPYGGIGLVELAQGAGEAAMLHVKFSFSGLQASALHCLGMQHSIV